MHFYIPLLASIATCLAAEPVVIGYYPSWKRSKFGPDNDLSKYTIINLAFGIPGEDGSFSFEDEWALPQITEQVRSAGAKLVLSVGGWTGSNHFSNIFKNDAAREKLLSSMVDYVGNNKLDGIDIDWEYPGRLGNNCNVFDEANDTPNFLSFLKDLRSKFDSKFGERKRLITLAVRVQPFDVRGLPSTDVAEFAKYVDYANIMQYDIGGAWEADTGPNAPFKSTPGRGPQVSYVTAIDSWLDAGWPAKQLVAGLAFYGRSTIAQQDMMRDATNQYQPQEHDVPLGDSEDAPWYDVCAGSTSNSGVWQWKHLRNQGVLTSPDTAAAPWVRQWDSVTNTPWLFNPKTKMFISYDDPDSIRIKSDYAAERGLAGVMVWSAEMENGELIDAARSFGGGKGNNTASAPSGQSSGSSPSADDSEATPPSSASSSSLMPLPTPTTPISLPEPKPTQSTTSGPSPSSDTGDILAPGVACSNNGRYRCVDGGGRNAAYLVCTGGRQVSASCAPGTVCTSFQGTIVCGWPSLKGLIEGVDSLLSRSF